MSRPQVDVVDDNDKDVILYPAGGAFNKLRCRQVFLETLIVHHWKGYTMTPSHKKRVYVRDQILQSISKSGRKLQIYKGADPQTGVLIEPDENEAIDRVAQKLRDTKKRELSKPTKKQQQQRRSSSSTRRSAAARKKSSMVKTKKATKRRRSVKPIKEDVDYHDDDDNDSDYSDNDGSSQSSSSSSVDAHSSSSPTSIQHVVWKQWDQLDHYRQLCASQKETIERLVMINNHQHNLLAANGLLPSNNDGIGGNNVVQHYHSDETLSPTATV